jgi:hypothetical protein
LKNSSDRTRAVDAQKKENAALKVFQANSILIIVLAMQSNQ